MPRLTVFSCALVASFAMLPASALAAFGFIKEWGSVGSGNGQIKGQSPDIAADKTGVYLLDDDNFRVQKFSHDGAFLWTAGGRGDGPSQFNSGLENAMRGAAVDPSGNFWVGDNGYPVNINRYTSGGAFLDEYPPYPNGRPALSGRICGLGVDPQGNSWVCTDYPGVFKFNASGGQTHPYNGPPWASGPIQPSTQYVAFGGSGSGPGQLSSPFDIAVDYLGNVWVSDSGNRRIQKMDSNGKFLLQFPTPTGTGPGQFSGAGPFGIGTDPQGNVWVADRQQGKIHKFSSTGQFLMTVGTGVATGVGKMYYPVDVAVDPSGNVYVIDEGTKILKFGETSTGGGGTGGGGTGGGGTGGGGNPVAFRVHISGPRKQKLKDHKANVSVKCTYSCQVTLDGFVRYGRKTKFDFKDVTFNILTANKSYDKTLTLKPKTWGPERRLWDIEEEAKVQITATAHRFNVRGKDVDQYTAPVGG